MIMLIGCMGWAKGPAVSNTIWPPAVPTPQCVGFPAVGVPGPVLVTLINEPAWDNRLGAPSEPELPVSAT